MHIIEWHDSEKGITEVCPLHALPAFPFCFSFEGWFLVRVCRAGSPLILCCRGIAKVAAATLGKALQGNGDVHYLDLQLSSHTDISKEFHPLS